MRSAIMLGRRAAMWAMREAKAARGVMCWSVTNQLHHHQRHNRHRDIYVSISRGRGGSTQARHVAGALDCDFATFMAQNACDAASRAAAGLRVHLIRLVLVDNDVVDPVPLLRVRAALVKHDLRGISRTAATHRMQALGCLTACSSAGSSKDLRLTGDPGTGGVPTMWSNDRRWLCGDGSAARSCDALLSVMGVPGASAGGSTCSIGTGDSGQTTPTSCKDVTGEQESPGSDLLHSAGELDRRVRVCGGMDQQLTQPLQRERRSTCKSAPHFNVIMRPLTRRAAQRHRGCRCATA